MKNKIHTHKNIKQTKTMKYFNMISFILKVIKLIVMFVITICIFIYIIFQIIYMSYYKFFSYDLLLLLNNIWLFVYMFLSTSIISVIAIPINLAFYIWRNKNGFNCLFVICVIIELFIVAILVCAGLYGKGLDFVLFCIAIASAYFIFIEACIEFYNKRNPSVLIVAMLIIPTMIMLVAISNPNPFRDAIKSVLTNKSLAADKVEIYLKDKNQFVIGKMVFRDSKFAYVIYDDINSSNNGTDSKEQYRANKLVPIENVTILNPLPQDSTLQK